MIDNVDPGAFVYIEQMSANPARSNRQDHNLITDPINNEPLPPFTVDTLTPTYENVASTNENQSTTRDVLPTYLYEALPPDQQQAIDAIRDSAPGATINSMTWLARLAIEDTPKTRALLQRIISRINAAFSVGFDVRIVNVAARGTGKYFLGTPDEEAAAMMQPEQAKNTARSPKVERQQNKGTNTVDDIGAIEHQDAPTASTDNAHTMVEPIMIDEDQRIVKDTLQSLQAAAVLYEGKRDYPLMTIRPIGDAPQTNYDNETDTADQTQTRLDERQRLAYEQVVQSGKLNLAEIIMHNLGSLKQKGVAVGDYTQHTSLPQNGARTLDMLIPAEKLALLQEALPSQTDFTTKQKKAVFDGLLQDTILYCARLARLPRLRLTERQASLLKNYMALLDIDIATDHTFKKAWRETRFAPTLEDRERQLYIDLHTYFNGGFRAKIEAEKIAAA